MARPLRIEHIGAWYHITARGNERRAVFRDDGDRTHFLELLGRTTERFGVDVCCFALIDNHYHLLLRLREARDRHGDRSRDLALYLGRMRGGMKLKELAEACGVKHYGAVAMALRRYENRMQKDKSEKQKLNTAIQMLNVKM